MNTTPGSCKRGLNRTSSTFHETQTVSLFNHNNRPGGECGNGPPTGKFMGTSGLGQLWGAEFENRWYTGIGRGLQPRSRDSVSRFW